MKQRMLHGINHDLFGQRDAPRQQSGSGEVVTGRICGSGVDSHLLALPASVSAVGKTGGAKS